MKRIIFLVSFALVNLSNAQKTKPDKVEVKKSKDGSNVYNFNFYNNKSDKKEKNKKDETKKEEVKNEDLVVYKKRDEIKKGNGVEAGIFTMSHLGDLGEVADLDLGLGLKIGFVMMSENSGLYFTPGFFIMDAGAEYDGLDNDFIARQYDGSAFGGYFKIGKLIDRGSRFSIDAGIEGSYMLGEIETSNFFGNGNYKFNGANFSAYGGPVFKVENFLISGILNLGVSQISVDESVTDSGFSPETTKYSDEKLVPFYGLSINATFIF